MSVRGTAALITAVALALSLLNAGCKRAQSAEVAQTAEAVGPVDAPGVAPESGIIRISGAWALYPMVVTWAEGYQKANPGVRIDVSAGGAGKGAADALGGLVDIGMVSRDIQPDEIDKGAWFVPMVKDAVFPTMNEANPAADAILTRGLKPETFVAIWITQTVKTWGQATGSAIKDPIHVFTRSDSCGAAETWAKFLGRDLKQESLKGTGVYGDPGLAQAVRRDKLAVGYNNLNFAYDTGSGDPIAGIRIIPIDTNANGRLDPEEDFYGNKSEVLKAIQEDRYPSPPARYLNFLCKGRPTGATADFIRWCLEEGQEAAEPAGYIALTAAKRAEALAQLK